MFRYIMCVLLLLSSSAFGCAAHQELGLNADWEKLLYIEQIKARESGLKLGLSTDLAERFNDQQQWQKTREDNQENMQSLHWD